jgi:hypothetical protein
MRVCDNTPAAKTLDQALVGQRQPNWLTEKMLLNTTDTPATAAPNHPGQEASSTSRGVNSPQAIVSYPNITILSSFVNIIFKYFTTLPLTYHYFSHTFLRVPSYPSWFNYPFLQFLHSFRSKNFSQNTPIFHFIQHSILTIYFS